MKKITLLFALLISSIGFSQQVLLDDFESSPTIAGFEGIGEASIAAAPEGSNGDSFKIITSTSGRPWQGASVDFASGILVDLTTDKTITVDVYSTVALSLMAKAEDKVNNTAPAAANTQSHTGNGWETLTFSFTTGSDGSATANGDYSRISFFPNRTSGDDGWNDPIIDATIYIDNIKGTKKTATPPPADPVPPTAAPSPTNSDTTILSIYNDTGAFTGNSATWTPDYDFGENGGNVNLSTTGTNNALKLNFSNAGWGAGTNSPVDITGMTHLHFDYYAPNLAAGSLGHEFKFIIIGEGQGEKDYVFKESGADAVIVFDQWVSVDIPLSHFEALGLTKDKFLQYKLGSTSDLNTTLVYFDNIYIYNSATASVDNNTLLGFSMYPNPANNVLNISAKETIKNADIFNVLGKKVMSVNINKANGSIDVSNLSSGIYLIKYNVNDKVGTAKFIKQ